MAGLSQSTPTWEDGVPFSILTDLGDCRNVNFVNPFEFLGVEPDATEQEIKSAYRQKLKQLHPDKHVGAPDHIVSQLAEFTQQLNDVYKDLNLNLDHYRLLYTREKPKVVNKPNPFSFSSSTLSQIERANVSAANLNQLLEEFRFPHRTSNLVLTAIRMRSLALKRPAMEEGFPFQFAIMFVLGAEIARLIIGQNLGETGDVLDLKGLESQSYLQGATDDAKYFMDINDSDLQSFITALPSSIGTWVIEEIKKISNGVREAELVLQRFIVSGMVFILFQV
jgi:curved DNA-binding protein CbpA